MNALYSLKVNLLLAFLLLTGIFNNANSQSPLMKQWDAGYGGTFSDLLTTFQQTNDGGYILAGYSKSLAGGDKTQTLWGGQGDDDFWIVKIDANGAKQWDKDFGGTFSDRLYGVKQTPDGGYLLAGESISGVTGDKTQPVKGNTDFWILKIDSAGNKLWDRDYGGTDYDYLSTLTATSDGGFMLGGVSRSPAGADKSQGNQGGWDFWIIKIDSAGNKLWDKTFGGNDHDYLNAVVQSSDGGYVLAGYSLSDVSGDKTQPTWLLYDYWIVKTDSAGNYMWDRDYGGFGNEYINSMLETPDGGFLFAGISDSQNSGDKTDPGYGALDFWMIKTDSQGYLLWDKDYGGNDDEDYFGSLTLTSSGDYLLAGISYSNISGTKTENNLGLEQSWILLADSLGNVKWDKTIFTQGHDEEGFAIETADGCIAVANYTNSHVGGFKSMPNRDPAPYPSTTGDYWIVKLCDSVASVPVAEFNSVQDVNCNEVCVNFSDASTNNPVSHSWTFTGALTPSSNASDPTGICYNQSGTYDVTLVTCNAAGCDTVTHQVQITVAALPAVTVNGALNICNGDSTALTATPGFSSYMWNLNGNPLPDTINMITAVQPGTYVVSITDSNGCNTSDTAVVAAELVNISLGNDTSLCSGQQINLTATGNTGSYQWMLNGNVITLTDSIIQINQGGYYQVLVTDQSGCTATDDIQVTAFGLPVVTSIADTSLCDSLTSVVLLTNGASFYQWSPSTYLDDPASAAPVAMPLNTITYVVTGTDTNGCMNTDSVTVTVASRPLASFEVITSLSCKGIEARFDNQSSGALNYSWIFGDGTITDEQDPVHLYTMSSSVQVVLIAENQGCMDSSMMILQTAIPLFADSVSNIFTPNNDGLNDCFRVNVPAALYDCGSMEIFSRWGNKVFDTTTLKDCWNGKQNNTGTDLTEGVYFYIIRISDEEFHGTVTLSR